MGSLPPEGPARIHTHGQQDAQQDGVGDVVKLGDADAAEEVSM